MSAPTNPFAVPLAVAASPAKDKKGPVGGGDEPSTIDTALTSARSLAATTADADAPYSEEHVLMPTLGSSAPSAAQTPPHSTASSVMGASAVASDAGSDGGVGGVGNGNPDSERGIVGVGSSLVDGNGVDSQGAASFDQEESESREEGEEMAMPSAASYEGMEPNYLAAYDYVAQEEDELELKRGDALIVSEIGDDGWYVGFNTASGLVGTFPGNFVIELGPVEVEGDDEGGADALDTQAMDDVPGVSDGAGVGGEVTAHGAGEGDLTVDDEELARQLQAELALQDRELEEQLSSDAALALMLQEDQQQQEQEQQQQSGSRQGKAPRVASARSGSAKATGAIVKRNDYEEFQVKFLGSLSTRKAESDATLVEAMHNIVEARRRQKVTTAKPYELQVSLRGIRLVELVVQQQAKRLSFRKKPQQLVKTERASLFPLKNVARTAISPNNYKLFAFMTREPRGGDKAVHIFEHSKPASLVVNAIGRAFYEASRQRQKQQAQQQSQRQPQGQRQGQPQRQPQRSQPHRQ
eukprot:m.69191 g.69191  ORF g.69191 m.69191 type:complete len:525 (+) comp12218_c2_seq1:446-2020(+)